MNRATGARRVGMHSAWLGRPDDGSLVKRMLATRRTAVLVIQLAIFYSSTQTSRCMREASGHQVHEDLPCDVRHLVAMVSS